MRGEPLDHLLLYGPPGLGKTTLAVYRGPRDGRADPHHKRPGHRKARRPGRSSDESAGGRRAVHRRDPPPVPAGGGGAVSGAGGLCAGHHDRQGTVGTIHPHQPAALYAGGSDDPRRARSPARCATASACCSSWSFTRPQELAKIIRRSAGYLGCSLRGGRRSGNGEVQPRHAARGEPSAQARAGFCRCAGRRRDRRIHRPGSAAAHGHRRHWAWTRWTGACCGPSSKCMAAARWVWRPLPRRWERKP